MNAINGALQRFRVPYGEESRSGITEMSSVISFQKDRASASEVSMIGLQSLYKGSNNLHCISHTITHVGEHMPANDAKRFTEDLCALCNSHGGNNKAASHWRVIFSTCWQPPGNTRWWAKLELYKKMFLRFDDLISFCMTAEADGDMERSARMKRLSDTVSCDEQRAILRLQLAVLTLVAGHLVSATYNLEGDKCCSLVTYDTIKDCESWLNDHYEHLTYPGIEAEIEDCVKTLIGGNESYEGMGVDELKTDLRDKIKIILDGAVKYFNNTLIIKLSPDVEIYRTCKFANPIAMRHVMLSPNTLLDFKEAVKNLQRFTRNEVENMAGEWHQYKRLVHEFEMLPSDSTMDGQFERCPIFWAHYHKVIPTLAIFARYCMTLTPSSAAAERVFSHLKSSFTIGQMRQSLEDYTEGSLMLQYNKFRAL